ncbi:glycosyltransferase involved in cell wall biosynthesis [Mariniflexile fucanivorans]|uniref:Glycosyltransferase involved in cell wall biosynthesis n=1 Tax=Mariniflexile fucanivorans TaxID=264023 RepID=A0A4R1RLA3_9FLAO|nr:glycosyltransferase [Mariniflexile fucanivorans]TCL66650.1 glycosyltransferase involved in cell wall biosynthesis [Mariniflexile fucanivorans]
MTPFFSVIIPLYNKEAFIESTLKSVLQQTFQDFEIIIVDDGSTDNSYRVASAFKNDKVLLLKQENKGVSIARNFGIDHATSKYIALLDADDLWYENHLLELKKQIDLFPDAGLYCNNYEIFYREGYSQKACFNFEYSLECLIVNDFFNASIVNTVAWTSAVGFSKEIFKNMGGFNPYYKTTQDLDLWIRFALKHKVSFNPTITMSYKLYINDSLSKNENEYNNIRYDFIKSYAKEEKANTSLKLYLDINRYALALRCKTHGKLDLYKKLKNEIDYTNLNWKQKLFLNTPKVLLILIKKFQRFLIKNRIYLTAYK